MPVVLDPPSHLLFKRPLTQPIEHVLHLQNVGTEPIAFKVKTTTPKQYCVKPNIGILSPSSQAEVQVIFQPFIEEPAPDFKCKDKFLVQTAEIKSEWSELTIAQFWTLIETDYAEVISRRKVKCVFLPPELPQPYTNGSDLDEKHYDRISLDTNKIRHGNENGDNTKRNNEDPPSPTIPSTNAVDSVKSIYNYNKPYDPSTSSTSLFSTHTAIASTPVHFQQQQQQQQHISPRQPVTTPYSPSFLTSPSPPSPPITNPILVQQLKEENEQLQNHLTTVRSHNITLGQQLIKEQSELKSAQELTDRLQQRIKRLEKETATATTDRIHATLNVQTSHLPADGYPPQVLLSVSALVFIVTLIFF